MKLNLKRLLCPLKRFHKYKNATPVEIDGKWYLTAICIRCGKVYKKQLKVDEK